MKKALLVLLLFVSSVSADGYTYRNGLYYRGDTAYNRVQVWTPPVYANCCYTAGYWTIAYHPVQYTAAAYVAPAYAPGWQGQLLRIAEAKVASENKIQLAAYDHYAYMQAIEAFGMRGLLTPRIVGTPMYPNMLNSYGQSYSATGVQANTIFGYNQTVRTNGPIPLDVNATAQMQFQANQFAQATGRESNQLFLKTTSDAIDGQLQLQKMIQRSQTATQLMQLLDGINTETKTQIFRIGPPDASGLPRVDRGDIPGDATERLNSWVESAKSCVECHSGEAGKDRPFKLEQYRTLNMDQKREVWMRLLSPDPKIRMPKGKPAIPMSEFKLWVLN